MEVLMSKRTKVSVIIPCYNQGHFLNEAVDSVLASDYENIEIIIVNDGSTDEFTNKICSEISHPLIKVLHQENQGLPMARNNGINIATGDYILPLDSDDKIHHSYISKAAEILDNDNDIGVVYPNYEVFGDYNYVVEMKSSPPQTLLLRNIYIAGSMYRKSDFILVGGYKAEMRDGLEDWEFWLSMHEAGVKFHKIDEILFYYRVLKSDSMSKKFAKDKLLYFNSHKKIMKYHPNLYIDNLEKIIFDLLINYLCFVPMETKLYCTKKFLMSSFKPKNILKTFKKIIHQKVNLLKCVTSKEPEVLVTEIEKN